VGLDALLLVVTGALLHASWNLIAKNAAAGGQRFVFLSGLVSLVPAVPLGLGWWLAHGDTPGAVALAATFASAAIHLVYALVLQHGYRVSDLSVVYPLARGTGPLLSAFGAVLLLGERPSGWGWAGIALIVAGILLVAGGHRLLIGGIGPRVRAGIVWGALTGLLIATYTLLDGWTVKHLGMAPVLFYTLGLAFRSLMLAPFALRDRAALGAQWRTHWRHALGVGLLSPLAYLLVLIAMTRAPISYVAPAREISMMVGVLLGARLLKEGDVLPRLAGTALMVLGVAALAAA